MCFGYIIYDSIPSKYAKIEESFGGFIHRRVLRFEFEKSPLHTIIYGGFGTGKTYFVRQYLKSILNGELKERTHQVDKNNIEQGHVDKNNIDQGQEHGQKQDYQNIITVRKDERDWINPETGVPYDEFELGDINMITINNIQKFQISIILLDDVGSEFGTNIKYYFTEGRHNKIQMIVMCHKPAQIDNMSRMNCDSIYITTYNGAHLFKNFIATFNCEHEFYEISHELKNSYYNCPDGMANELRYGIVKYNIKKKPFKIIGENNTLIYESRVGHMELKAFSLKDKLESDEIDKLIAYTKPLMINARDRNTINADNYPFYFNKFLASRDIKIQNDVLTKEQLKRMV